jgi:hypothetical protein
MKIGYSLLLRELVPAVSIDYGDCATFQVTCPECKEAVFKSGNLDSDRQFLSHYAASKANVRDCELRVAAYKPRTITDLNFIGHGQALEEFFKTFQSKVIAWLYPDDQENVRRKLTWMVSRPAFIKFSRYEQNNFRLTIHRKDKPHENWNYLADDMLEHRSAFWVHQQKRFAQDFAEHVLAPNSEKAWHFVFGTMIFITSKIDQPIQDIMISGKDSVFEKTMNKLRGEKLKGTSRDMILGSTTMIGHSDVTALHLILHWASKAFYQFLFCIPYAEFLGDNITSLSSAKDRDLAFSMV